MPRIRTIKPEIVQSARLAECSRDARLLFVYLISQADCYGNQRGDARLLRGQMFPYDDDVTKALVEEWLDELEKRRLIRRYVLDEQIYVHLPNWSDNQKVSKPGPRSAPRAPGQPLADCDDPALGDPGCAWVTHDETDTAVSTPECIEHSRPRAARGGPGWPGEPLADLDLDLDLDQDQPTNVDVGVEGDPVDYFGDLS